MLDLSRLLQLRDTCKGEAAPHSGTAPAARCRAILGESWTPSGS
jgi:hypothetical protein